MGSLCQESTVFESARIVSAAETQTQAPTPLAQPIELSLEQLQQVSGGSPHGTWAPEGVSTMSPHGTW